MALETEIKLRVSDHESVRQALRSKGATFRKRELETNTFFDTKKCDLRDSGCGLRVRRATDQDTRSERCVITHKGPRKPGQMKIREETELAVANYDDAVRLLNQLGLDVVLMFEKTRETWDLGDCEVVLDELPAGLGRFVEIEGPGESEIQSMRQRLELSGARVEPEGYAVLVARYLNGRQENTLTFQT